MRSIITPMRHRDNRANGTGDRHLWATQVAQVGHAAVTRVGDCSGAGARSGDQTADEREPWGAGTVEPMRREVLPAIRPLAGFDGACSSP
jgi:hypothetical protein